MAQTLFFGPQNVKTLNDLFQGRFGDASSANQGTYVTGSASIEKLVYKNERAKEIYSKLIWRQAFLHRQWKSCSF